MACPKYRNHIPGESRDLHKSPESLSTEVSNANHKSLASCFVYNVGHEQGFINA